MVYIIQSGHMYIAQDKKNRPKTTLRMKDATTFSEEIKAEHYINNLGYPLKAEKWKVVGVHEKSLQTIIGIRRGAPLTELEKKSIDIIDILYDIIPIIAEVQEYSQAMNAEADKCSAIQQDILHYLRDENTKLNAVQMQRIGYFLQENARNRNYYKKRCLIAKQISDNHDKLFSKETLAEIDDYVHSE